MKNTKPKSASVVTFKQMLDAQDQYAGPYLEYKQQNEGRPEPSRLEYFKLSAREYLRFLFDPTLITGHIVKIGICLALLVYITPDSVMPDLPQFKITLQYILMLGVGFLVVTSATQSMLLPLVAIGASIAGETILKNHEILAKFDPIIMQYLLAAGICGICVAVFFRPSVQI